MFASPFSLAGLLQLDHEAFSWLRVACLEEEKEALN